MNKIFKIIWNIILISLFLVTMAKAKEVTLAWDYDYPDDIDGFKLYQKIGDGTYNYDQPVAIIPPEARTWVTDDLSELGYTFCWVLTAYKDNQESPNSNQACWGTPPLTPTNPDLVPDVPTGPGTE